MNKQGSHMRSNMLTEIKRQDFYEDEPLNIQGSLPKIIIEGQPFNEDE